MNQQTHHSSAIGAMNAIFAFLIWGLTPIYFKWIRVAAPLEILMHRIVWSFLFLLPLVLFFGHWEDFIQAIRVRQTRGILMVTTLLVSCNWFLFIYAINNDQILETSLGYYINPLINVLFGMIFLKERLRLAQWIAVGLAGAGVTYLTVQFGSLPWISLTLAITFGLYGLIRKVAPVGAMVGLTVETMLLFLPAVFYIGYLHHNGSGVFLHLGIRMDVLLMCSALVTAVPLLLFTYAARKINLSSVGIRQYIAPSSTFLLAVFVYGEPFDKTRLWTFILIWAALLIYSADSIRYYRKNHHTPSGASG